MVPLGLPIALRVQAGSGLSPHGIGKPSLGVNEATADRAQGREQPHVIDLESTDHRISGTRCAFAFWASRRQSSQGRE